MYDTLLNEINSYIRTNANNEITGIDLNYILTSMLQALGTGMRFYGIAAPSMRPVNDEYPKFYIAFTPGTYSNFNIALPVRFTSGFAILYDTQGNNTWQMSVKAAETSKESFVIDAQVRRSNFGTNTKFYVKNVTRSNQNCSFDVQAFNEDAQTEQLVATFTQAGLLSGYVTHKIVLESGLSIIVSANWDVLEVNDTVTYNIEDTKFPTTAYVETPADINIDYITRRLSALEASAGGYSFGADDVFNRVSKEAAGGLFYIAPNIDVSNILSLPEDIDDLEAQPYTGANIFTGYMSPNVTPGIFYMVLRSEDFIEESEYHFYLPNTIANDSISVLRLGYIDTSTMDAPLYADAYDFHSNTMLQIDIIKRSNGKLYHNVKTYSCAYTNSR